MQVRVKKLHDDAVIPKYAKPGDAGMDLVAMDCFYDTSTETWTCKTGLAIEIPEGYVGLIFPRSSICKTNLSLTNAVGVIDSGYRGEIAFKFHRRFGHFNRLGDYQPGDRVGQLIIVPYPQVELVEADDLSDSVRGTGGFGSSGK